MNNIKTINAFSLTEVLVTMFIIMLLIIASAPMITKKNVKNKNPHGVWECYLDDNGQHVSKTTLDGQSPTTKSEGNYCVFEPQTNAKVYTVMAIGGGGGGASGTSFAVDAISYGSPVSYTIQANGLYKILVVGGGGGGSARAGLAGNMGGGAGGVNLVEKNLKKGDLCTLEAGAGGVPGGSADPEAENLPEEDESCSGTTWKEVCRGKDGKSSKFYIYGDYSNAIEATGGKGGGQYLSDAGVSGDPACGSSANASWYEPGKVFSGGNCDKTKDFMESTSSGGNVDVTFGHGGGGSTTEDAYPGRNGVVMLISSQYHSGGGGKRGSTAYMSLNKITDEVKVYVGQGGAGAITEDTNGEQGQNSAFGYYITAKGGEGGRTRYKSSSLEWGGLDGENGAMSPYGGVLSGGTDSCSAEAMNGKNDMGTNNSIDKEKRGIKAANATNYGAGGGGGAAFSKNSAVCKMDERWGRGGRGMPGYVRVEWN